MHDRRFAMGLLQMQTVTGRAVTGALRSELSWARLALLEWCANIGKEWCEYRSTIVYPGVLVTQTLSLRV